mgnify:FL=1
MLVSVCVVAYNEEKVIGNLLNDIKNQDYPHDKIEILLIDSMSSDKTKQIMNEFKKKEMEFQNIQVLLNPKKKLAPGWNVALKNYNGDVIIRIDAHASIPKDFIRKNVEVLESGEFVSGGIRPNIIDENTPWKETLLLAEQSMFGSSIAPYRKGKKKTYVKSLFHGAYRREVFERVGLYNEQLGRTEDNEIHYRMRKAGFRLCYTPDIISYQHTRSTLKGMLKQKYGNGYWVALTLKACPGCLAVYHFVPLAFVMAIIITTVLAVAHIPIFSIIMWSLYWTIAVIMAVMSVRGKKKCWQQLLLPFLFFALHVSYGVGSLVGIIKLPFWKYKK